jgi:hypothetical protein
VTAISADALAAAAGADAVKDVARADAETRASPILNTRERRNAADVRLAALAINPFITFTSVKLWFGCLGEMA